MAAKKSQPKSTEPYDIPTVVVRAPELPPPPAKKGADPEPPKPKKG